MSPCSSSTSLALYCTAGSLLPLALLLLPRPYDDRLATIPESSTRIDTVRPFDAEEKWAANGSLAGLHRLNPARVAHFDRRIRALLSPPFRILDAGCGGGLVSNALARLPGYTVEGVDLSPQALRYAESTAADAGLHNVKFRESSVYTVPFANESFDAVIMSDVLEHLLDLPKVIAEVARVLKPGGVFLFDTIDRTWVSYLVAIIGAEGIVRILEWGSHDWRLFIKPEELRQGLERGGFGNFTYEAFDPSVRALAELSLFNVGLMAPEGMTGGWTIGPPSMLMVSYIGDCIKPGRQAPLDGVFKAGELVELLALKGPKKGSWVKARVTGVADAPRTYDLRVALARAPGYHDVRSAPRWTLRKAGQRGPAEARQVSHQPAAVYKAGEIVEVSDKTGKWFRCSILRPGVEPNTYDVRVPVPGEPGFQDFRSVPTRALRKFQVGEIVQVRDKTGTWNRCGILRPGVEPNTYDVRVPMAGDPGYLDVRGVPTRALRKFQAPVPDATAAGPLQASHQPAAVYKAGEIVELRDKAGKWVRGGVIRPGEEPNTYDVRVPMPGEPGYLDARSVPTRALRKFQAPVPDATAAGPLQASHQPAAVYKAGEIVELRDKAGKWIRCGVIRPGEEPNSYDVRVPMAAEPGFVDIRSVPTRALRKFQAEQVSFEADEFAEFRAVDGPKAGSWSPCKIVGKGKEPNTYKVRLAIVRDPGFQDLDNIPGDIMRKASQKVSVGERYKAGDVLQVQSDKGEWNDCTVVRMAWVPNTYVIWLHTASVIFHNVPHDLLRRPVLEELQPGAGDQAARMHAALKPQALQVGDAAEVISKDGWRRCIIESRGELPDTYNIRVVADEIHEVPNVHAKLLRRLSGPSTSSYVMNIMGALMR